MQESDLYQQQQTNNNNLTINGGNGQTSSSTDSTGELRSLTSQSGTYSFKEYVQCRLFFIAICLDARWKMGILFKDFENFVNGKVSFFLTVVIAGFNWFGNHILVRSSQHLAKKTGVPSLDYGHFAKRVCDKSDIPFLRSNSKRIMYIVNVTILFYQLGMCSVAILFIAENMIHLLGWLLGSSTTLMATIATIFIMATNMFTEMRVISLFAMISSVFFLLGAGVIMHFALQQPSHWSELPASTNFADTIIFIGMSMYAFEGQTMILPIENKLDNPDDFLDNFGVLPTTMCLCTLFMTAIGFFGYNAFGDNVAETITVNVPHTGLYSVVNVFLCVQSILGHSIAMYVVFDMFYKGFRRKFSNRFPTVSDFAIDKGFRFFWVFITYLMAVLIPRLAVLIPLVGVTSGTLCALVYPPLFQIITFWEDWKLNLTRMERYFYIGRNLFVIVLGFFAIVAGISANIIQIMNLQVN
uniref:Aa_trans domain-containing protein n=1 Tax=Meloidogyne hapla TaxID=6305 RepID=A0A1I8BAC2_MELHA